MIAATANGWTSMHISFVTETYPPEINGVALTVARSLSFLRSRGHAVDLVRPRRAGEAPGADEADDEWRVSGWPIPVYPDLRFGYASASTLATRFAATGAQLVHVATEGPLGWAAVTAARRLGLPTTSDFRTNFHQYGRYYGIGWLTPTIGAYLRRFHNRTDLSFVPTVQTQREVTAAGFERVEIVGRGVDVARFSPSKRDAALHARLSPEGGPLLLYVGRLAAEKNIGLALAAYRHARAVLDSARMLVVGDGPMRKRLERDHPDVSFVGNLTGDALAVHYASADVFLFPSLSDTFGNVTPEALASGLPVVAFNVAAAAELVEDGVSGRLLAPDDAAGFIAATSLLAQNHLQLAPMRRAARLSACSADWDSVLRRFEQQLAETLHAHQEPRASTICAA